MRYRFDSPLGPIGYDWDGLQCSAVRPGDTNGATAAGDPVYAWLSAYFKGERSELPQLAKPTTPFQKKMRKGLLTIPFGEVRTYGALAQQLGTAPRAMGQALGANPLPILIPCHRVVAANGPGGFACGPEWKQKLLAFEGSR